MSLLEARQQVDERIRWLSQSYIVNTYWLIAAVR